MFQPKAAPVARLAGGSGPEARAMKAAFKKGDQVRLKGIELRALKPDEIRRNQTTPRFEAPKQGRQP